jgi:hypothetical protein
MPAETRSRSATLTTSLRSSASEPGQGKNSPAARLRAGVSLVRPACLDRARKPLCGPRFRQSRRAISLRADFVIFQFPLHSARTFLARSSARRGQQSPSCQRSWQRPGHDSQGTKTAGPISTEKSALLAVPLKSGGTRELNRIRGIESSPLARQRERGRG